MRPTPALKWLLIFLIPLTFTWKLVAVDQAVHEMHGDITQFLAIRDFDVTAQAPVDGVSVVRATKGDCDMILAKTFPNELTRYAMRYLAAKKDEHFVVLGGNIYDDQQTWLIITRDLWNRFLRKLGLSQSRAPLFMVAATHSCAARQLPWAELSGGGYRSGPSS
jgi:hypothetical protein